MATASSMGLHAYQKLLRHCSRLFAESLNNLLHEIVQQPWQALLLTSEHGPPTHLLQAKLVSDALFAMMSFQTSTEDVNSLDG